MPTILPFDPDRAESPAQLASRVAELLIRRGETVSVVESSGAGLISSALLSVPGASRFYVGGAVVYTAEARAALLGIDLDRMAGLRSSSEPYATLLSATVRERIGTTWGLAETGAAGPSGNRYGDAAGHTCLAVAGPLDRVGTVETGLSDRRRNMELFTSAALALFAACLEETSTS